MAAPLGSAEWQRLAEQCRARADILKDPIISERMSMIADGYDRIAHDAKKIEARNPCCSSMSDIRGPLTKADIIREGTRVGTQTSRVLIFPAATSSMYRRHAGDSR